MDYDALLKRLQAMPWANQWRLLAGFALLVVGSLALGIWGFSTDYAPLYPSLAEKDSGAVMAALDQNGYAYKLSANGVIQVERTKVYEARYKLAAIGLPKTVQDDTSAPPKFGATSTQEQAYQQKIKEIELARTINGISGISGARVHLALPHQTIFGKETTPTTASVVIDGAGGVSRSQAAAISHLVANATPGLHSADVSIIDGQGKLLTQDNDNMGDTPEQRSYTKEFRADLQARVEHLLTPLVGPNKAKAEIDVDLEFGNEEAVTESWRPNSGEAAIRSQQSSDTKNSAGSASGIPGSATNTLPLALPPLPTQGASSPKAESSTGASQSVTNYELDRSVTKSIRKGVKIRKIRAAVLVDYKKVATKDGKMGSIPMTPSELSKIQSLIQESIGLDEDRGDSIQVMNSPFLEEAASTDDKSPPIWKDPYMIELAMLAMKWLAIIIGVVWLARTARNTLSLLGTAEENEKSSGEDDGSEPKSARTTITVDEDAIDINAVRQVAQGNPQAVASVIKGWVGGDGNE